MFRVREDKQFLNNPRLVFRVNEKYTSWNEAAPILMAVIMFKVGKFSVLPLFWKKEKTIRC